MHDLRTLVTGGTRGIGAAVAHRLAAAGHDLVLGYRADREAAEGTAASVRALGVSCDLVAADLADPAGVDVLFAGVGPLTGVVNNAGWAGPIGPLAETDPDVVRRVVEVNLVAPLLVARAAVRALGRSHGGSGGVLVNISSGAATLGSPGEYVHYAAAKAGLDTLTLGLGKEAGRTASGSWAWRPGRSGPGCTPTPATPTGWTGSAAPCRSAGPASPTRSRPPSRG